MSDKLEALSQPIGLVTNQLDGAVIVESDQLLPGDDVYSQEYVTALLAALEEKDQSIAELNVKLFDQSILLDAAISRAEASERREEHLKATVDVLSAKNAELEQQLSRTNSMLSESIAALKAAEEQIEQLKRAKL